MEVRVDRELDPKRFEASWSLTPIIIRGFRP